MKKSKDRKQWQPRRGCRERANISVSRAYRRYFASDTPADRCCRNVKFGVSPLFSQICSRNIDHVKLSQNNLHDIHIHAAPAATCEARASRSYSPVGLPAPSCRCRVINVNSLAAYQENRAAYKMITPRPVSRAHLTASCGE